MEKVLELLPGPVRVLGEDGLDFIGAEPREVHLADPIFHGEEAAAAAAAVVREGAGAGGEDGSMVRWWGVLRMGNEGRGGVS